VSGAKASQITANSCGDINMPTIEDNRKMWDGGHNWSNRGDEWSVAWGGSFMQWYGTIFPRIKAHVPTNSILEIACGCGRWTQYLKDLCNHLTAIDLSEECILTCKQRFAECSHIEYHVNDGRSLDMIPDSSIDFVFSFDSLVHVDESVIEAYLSQLPRILSNNGLAFLHHSNLGEYRESFSRIRKIPLLKSILTRLGVLDKNLHWRDLSVDARKVEALAEKHGLRCVSQEVVLWATKRTFLDCMSTIAKGSSPKRATNQVLRNARFMEEAMNLQELSRLYNPEK
jgi:ubiquinone/menaquinone biosynthesis C-methylase UbiE